MTTTLTLSPAEIESLRKRLERHGCDFRPLQHAHFQARAPGLVVSAYRSGKIVFSGAAAERFLGEEGLLEGSLEGPVVGSDESGKGDYFGPLVVAAVLVRPEHEPDLARAGVQDCKRMSDDRILKAAATIRTLCPHRVRALDPAAYNAAHEREGNVALFLARLHAEAIAGALEGAETGEAVHVVIDQFTRRERLTAELTRLGVESTVEIRPRAEDNPAVAAASVLARAEFLLELRELGHAFGITLPKGAGAPVERAARDLVAAAGVDALRSLVKWHFKTTKKITERLF